MFPFDINYIIVYGEKRHSWRWETCKSSRQNKIKTESYKIKTVTLIKPWCDRFLLITYKPLWIISILKSMQDLFINWQINSSRFLTQNSFADDYKQGIPAELFYLLQHVHNCGRSRCNLRHERILPCRLCFSEACDNALHDVSQLLQRLWILLQSLQAFFFCLSGHTVIHVGPFVILTGRGIFQILHSRSNLTVMQIFEP